MGCRFPGGVDNPEQFWDLLRDGRSGIVRVPSQRWDADALFTEDHTVPGTICNREGGFLSNWEPDEFDAEFFSITPREAAAMDPQQRLFLEVAFEALENAGIPPHTIRGTQTSVFVGVTAYDYMLKMSGTVRPVDLDAYVLTGNSANFAAGRMAYLLGARGPAVVLDTACSSSLVSIHLACQSLRWRESDTALVGGTNLLLTPGTSIACSRWGMLSPEGQCKTFDAGADGYVRSEGAGVVVLKRLSDAQRDGNRILAVVRGSAVNQDGASSGVTVPNGPAQQALLRQALTSAKLTPADIDYIEAHGTGTPLGDPIELDSLSKVFADRQDRAPLVLGAVKTNLGHLEAAAGIAGFMKTVLAVGHGRIPRNLNFRELTPHASEGVSRLTIATEDMEWPDTGQPHRAGVSSFGVSGTNAHIVVEQAEDPVPVPHQGSGPAVTTLLVSGKTKQRVAATAAVLADWMDGPGADVALADVAHTLNHHRARQTKFATVAAADRDQAVAELRALAAGEPAPGVVDCHEGSVGPGTVFVYSGRGSQWPGMGRQLLADEPAFAAAVAELEPTFVAEAGFSLHDMIATGKELDGIEQIQLGLIGMQIALTALWRSYGVTPDLVIGHSMGEVAAAVVAGALTPAEGLRVTATRSRLMAPLSGQGTMAMLELDADATEALLADHPQVTLGIYASPRQTVISGPTAQIDELIATVRAQGQFASQVNIEVAPHNPAMDALQPAMRAELAGLDPQPPTIPVISTTYENLQAPAAFDAEHWATNMRNPVRFQQAITAAAAEHHTFIEVSAHPLLTHAITETLAARENDGGADYLSLGTLQRDAHDTLTFHTNLNTTHTSRPPQTPHPCEPHPVLPTTPWQHTRHWIAPTIPAHHTADTHPLLGIGVTDPGTGTRIWECELCPDLLWLGDHVIDDLCVLPGSAYAEVALAAATNAFADAEGSAGWMIRELSLHQMLHVTEDTLLVTTLTGDEQTCRIEMRTQNATSGWIKHATATVARETASEDEVPRPAPLDEVADELNPEELYQRLRGAGQQHGPAFRGIVGLAVEKSGAARADVRLPATAKTGFRCFGLHPVMMDIAVQALGATRIATDLAGGQSARQTLVLPIRFAGVHVYGDITGGVCSIGSLAATDSPDRLRGHVTLTDPDDRPVLVIDEVEMAVLGSSGGTTELGSQLYTVQWEPAPLDKPAGTLGGVLLIGDDPLLPALRSSLRDAVADIEVVSGADAASLRAAITRNPWDSIVVVCPPRSVDKALDDEAQLELAQARTLLIADIAKTVTRMGARNSPRLWIVTRGAQQLDPGDPVTLAQTQLRGIARVLTFEHPELRTTIVDIDADGSGTLTALTEELLAGADHDEIALRDQQRYVNRLVPAPVDAAGELAAESRRTVVSLDGDGAVRLQIDRPGRLDELKVHAVKRIPPSAGQVEVRVVAAGLNFSDVLKAMGVYPGLDGAPPVIGGECVGFVTAVGPDVDAVEVGQRVIAFGPGTFASHMTTLADLVAPVPEALPDGEAAAFGIAYLTAWHSLCEVGRLAPGERVLIHSATGGVGLAAVSIAKMIGARIYTTAGSDAKREMLAGLGVEYVGNSRDVEFADEILDITDGYGVDVILNSLPGEAIHRGVQILAPCGRFIELGKKDVHADASLGLAALAKSASFAVVDLDLNLKLQPARYREMLGHILAHVADGKLQVLPVTEFTLSDAADAFRLMASGRHTGKIVVSIPAGGDIEAIAAPPPLPLVSPDGGYLIVGGMGGLGFVVAQWLVDQGAGLVVLNGRSAPSDETRSAIAELNAAGSRIEVVTGDIADADTAGRLVRAVEDAGFRVAGVLHSAMVLDDEIVLNVTDAAARRVFTPKVTGSWRLHQATAHLDVDWWLTFSSVASLLGAPGQGTYAAANSWVDGLVAHRRSLGLPAVGINWGPWAEVGRAQFFADLGVAMITVEQGLAAMQLALAADRARTGVFSLDARQWFQSFPSAAGSSLFAKLQDLTPTERRGGGAIRAELDACDAAERPARLATAIAGEIRAVLRSTEPIDPDRPMESLGLDSLMALELRNRLEASLGTMLPAALVWAYPTITDLAGALCERLGYEAIGEAEPAPEAESELSDEEMELLSDLVAASELETATGGSE
ncbi:Phthiocerol/phenolphthiocerol synthesis polyketide synthase type I PpsC [Mycobacterium montefiorense]|uniref:Phthiocerol/phenolphthiocerol synthesis polyketide synthase type I PpsC n=5 Tax=Mycobacterium montefiorense TaxID=154654 RepID=A0AA37UR86_9MYCO|nr:Phthiocerol/phenolphthiocerol synthesis polyketide synthase type I PpsC [Mycobacterium montefiorense]GKU37117.1 phthiocerol/phenolphthiocerol synthesis polyketide synthase type I PpsC [Mycobacterium montefiorense]GKU43367.1 phthiocerol/phenolphthiocerol synthesis polyketide synthase type I PpsC [Mycobacterium montefiorense]GKU53658.1 phthiocerol/phenolphthiocerol synthesis polyketide synthase type I PpsC [Mycobacterium montefiorense]GKU63586.1 phthiocerol/phenolphthiocerol synthesis polyketi